MIENTYYTQKFHGPYTYYSIGDFTLEDGGMIPNCTLAYATYGALNAAKNNAILMTTWYSGTHKILENYFGTGRPLDPNRYFIILVNQIGSGLSSSPHNTLAPYGMENFPHVRISDDVRAQHQFLTEKFGLTQLALVMGGSMGGQQTFEWCCRYPEMVKRAAALASTPKNNPHDFLFADSIRETLQADPTWQNGKYTTPDAGADGLKRHAKIFASLGYCYDYFKKEAWRTLGFDSLEAFITRYVERYYLPMDVNNLLCQIWKWQRADVSRLTDGNLSKALGRIQAKVFVMPIDRDMIFPVEDCAEQQALIPNSELHVLHSICGHQGLFGLEQEYLNQVDQHLQDLLSISV